MNAYSFGGPGHRLGRGNRLSRLLDTRSNNGTVAGGLSSVLANLLIGLEAGQDRRDSKDADKAFSKGMSAKQWTPPDEKVALGPTGSEGADKFITREEAMERAAPAGGADGALYALSQLEDNPYAGRLSRKLSLDKMELDRKASEKAADRAYDATTWENRLDAQTEKQKDLLKFRLDNTPKNETPESFTSIKEMMGPDGKPAMVMIGNRGTVRPVDGYQPVPDAPKEQGGPFGGTGMTAQALNAIATADPNSVEFMLARSHLSQPQVRVDPQSGQQIVIKPDMSVIDDVLKKRFGGNAGVNVNAQATPQQAPQQPGSPQMAAQSPQAVGQAAPQMPDNRGGVEVSQVPGMQGRNTPAQKRVDTEFAKSYAEFYANGGFADALKNLEQIKGVAQQLSAIADGSSDANLTGPVLGRTPDAVLSMVNPDAVNTREAVEEVVQRNLRAVLGSQFTQTEGDRLIKRAYNPTLSEAQNAERLQRLAKAMEGALNARQNAARYYEENGTLAGFKGTAEISVGDLEAAIDGGSSQAVQGDFTPSKPEDMDSAPVGATFIQNGMRFTKKAAGAGGKKWSVEALGGDVAEDDRLDSRRR